MMVPYEEPRRRPRQQQHRAPRPNSHHHGPDSAALVVYNPQQQRQVAPARQPHQEFPSKGPLHLRDVDIRQSYKVSDPTENLDLKARRHPVPRHDWMSTHNNGWQNLEPNHLTP